jgi:hypothetical protein
MYTSSSGSLIGVLKRTNDSASTNPSDNASEDLTTDITRKVVWQIIGRTRPRSLRMKRIFARKLKCQLKTKDSIMDSRKFQSKLPMEISSKFTSVLRSVILN